MDIGENKMDVDSKDFKKKRSRSTDTGEENFSPSPCDVTTICKLQESEAVSQSSDISRSRSYTRNKKANTSSLPLSSANVGKSPKNPTKDKTITSNSTEDTASSPAQDEFEAFDDKCKPPFVVFLRYQNKERRISILKASNSLAKLDIKHKSIESYLWNTWQLTSDDKLNANRCLLILPSVRMAI